MASLMFLYPACRRSVIQTFLAAARTSGAEPVRTRQKVLAHREVPHVEDRVLVPGARERSPLSFAASAFPALRLVMPCTTSVVVSSPIFLVRVTRPTPTSFEEVRLGRADSVEARPVGQVLLENPGDLDLAALDAAAALRDLAGRLDLRLPLSQVRRGENGPSKAAWMCSRRVGLSSFTRKT